MNGGLFCHVALHNICSLSMSVGSSVVPGKSYV